MRDKDMREIDLLIVRDGVCHPVEIKKTAMPRAGDIHLGMCEKTGMPVGHGAVVCLAATPLPVTENLTAMPVGYI